MLTKHLLKFFTQESWVKVANWRKPTTPRWTASLTTRKFLSLHTWSRRSTQCPHNLSNIQLSQRKRCAPSWLKDKPSLEIGFTQDSVTMKVMESWKITLSKHSEESGGSLSNFTFHVHQVVWCYRKTANGKEKTYFKAHITDVWDNAVAVTEISSTAVDETSSDKSVINENKEGEGDISHFTWVNSAQ